MLVVELTSCSMLSMRVRSFVRIKKMHFVLVFHLVLVYSSPSSIVHSSLSSSRKKRILWFQFFLVPRLQGDVVAFFVNMLT